MKFIGLGLHVGTALLVTFKLVGALEWPWLWVLAPSLCALAIGAVLLALAGIAVLFHRHFMRTDPNYRLKRAFENFERAYTKRR